MIQDAAGGIDYGEEGSGPTILFVPGSWATRSAWREVAAPLKGSYRIVTTCLLGYGRTDERRTSADAAIDHEIAALRAVVDRAGSDVHLVGHSFGAVVSLATALRVPNRIASLTLIEPPFFNLLGHAREHKLFETMTTMTSAYFRAHAIGVSDAARLVIDFYGGDGSFDAFPATFRNYVVATTATNILDWATAMGFDEAPEAFAAIGVPAVVIRGERGHPAVSRVAEILADALPCARLATVKDAGHFMIMTHGPEVASQIDAHVSEVVRETAAGKA